MGNLLWLRDPLLHGSTIVSACTLLVMTRQGVNLLFVVGAQRRCAPTADAPKKSAF